MTAPPRLLESSQSPATRKLLLAGQREKPRASALRATALAVGVTSSVVAASTTATAAAGSGTALAAPSLALVAAKWVAVGTLGGLALAGTASVVSDVASPRAAAPTAHVERRGHALAGRDQPPEPEVERRSASDGSPPVNDISGRSLPAAAAPAKPPGSTQSRAISQKEPAAPAAPASASLPAAQSLSREIALIDGARRSLADGDSRAALHELDRYAALLRTGTLDREADLLRIDALSQMGQAAQALSLAERYLESYPNDPHAARLRALVSTR